MAYPSRNFAVDFNRRKVFANPTFEESYTFGHFVSGDTERLRVYIVEPSTASGAAKGALTPLSTSGVTLVVAIGTRTAGAAGTVYTSVTLTADSDGKYFEGDLPLNVAAITALFSSSAANQSAYIELELNEGGYRRTHAETVTIVQQIISTTLADTPLPDVAIGNQEATGRFVAKVNTDSNVPFDMIVNDSDGSGRLYRMYVYGGVLRLDPLGT